MGSISPRWSLGWGALTVARSCKKAVQQDEESAAQSRELERQAARALLADLEKNGKLSHAATAYFMARVP